MELGERVERRTENVRDNVIMTLQANVRESRDSFIQTQTGLVKKYPMNANITKFIQPV